MESTDLTIEILKSIRDEVRKTNERIDHLAGRVDNLSDRVDNVGDRVDTLEHRLVESEMRTATALTQVAGSLTKLNELLHEQLDLRPRVEKCEREIDRINLKLTS